MISTIGTVYRSHTGVEMQDALFHGGKERVHVAIERVPSRHADVGGMRPRGLGQAAGREIADEFVQHLGARQERVIQMHPEKGSPPPHQRPAAMLLHSLNGPDHDGVLTCRKDVLHLAKEMRRRSGDFQ